MAIWSAIPVVGKVIDKVFGLVDQVVEDKDERARLKHALESQLAQQDFTVEIEEIKAAASIVAAEAQGESWLQRNWRPILMLVFTYIVLHNYVLAPLAGYPPVEIPPNMWHLLQIGVGGYVVGRSAEKGIKTWKEAK